MNDAQRREVNEAIAAGERALESLRDAAEALESAARWGAFDIFVGGGLTSMMKHVRIDRARTALAETRAYLRAFLRELDDVTGVDKLRVDVGGALTAVDVLFDNPLVDIFVQRKIDDARDKVDAAIVATETVLARLRGMR